MLKAIVASVGLLFAVACGSSSESAELPADGDSGARAEAQRDAATGQRADDAESPDFRTDAAIDAGAGEVCGNGLDDDGNGRIDEGCACEPGATQKCYVGAKAQAGVGGCVWGKQTCERTGGGEFAQTAWGACTGSGAPKAETCNDVDDDCNGKTDDGAKGSVCSNCTGTGRIFASIGDDCIDDGGGSAPGDTLEVYCVNDIARFCLSKEACPWRSGGSTSDAVTCSRSGLSSTYMASARNSCGVWQGHNRYCCSAAGRASFGGC